MAALASFGSAFAQAAAPSIVPYARIDFGVNNTSVTGASNSGLVASSGAYNSNYWGLKGEQDLGNGLKGFAQLENSIDFVGNNGMANGGRVGIVGLKGGFGTVQIGSMWGPFDNTAATGDAQDESSYSAYTNVYSAGAHGDNGNGGSHGNTAGSIQYSTPSMGGLVVDINYAPKKTADNSTDISSFGIDATYSNGPLFGAIAYDSTPTSVSNVKTGASITGKTTGWHLEGGYNLTGFTVYAALLGGKADGTALGSDSDSGYALSVKMPVGKWTPSIGYGSMKTSGDDLNQKVTSYGLQALYSFSANFTGYLGYNSTKTTPDVGTESTTSKYGGGLTIKF